MNHLPGRLTAEDICRRADTKKPVIEIGGFTGKELLKRAIFWVLIPAAFVLWVWCSGG